MMLQHPYKFAVVLFSGDGTQLGSVPARESLFEPSYEWARFHFQRRGELAADAKDGAAIVPQWSDKCGQPYCSGYRVLMERGGMDPVASDFPITHFRPVAEAGASLLVTKGKLKAGDHYSYLVTAHAVEKQADAGALALVDMSPGLQLQQGALAELGSRSQARGPIDAEDMPVYVAAHVLQEAAVRTRAEEGTETGGILIGKLCRDVEGGEIFARITAQIPAEHTTASETKLTFTPRTWTAARAALRERGQGEVFLGYWHSHCVAQWCANKKCDEEARKNCSLARGFFSADDEAVMRAVFPRAYNVGLVANDAPGGLTFSMFGLREGVMQARGFSVLEEEARGTNTQ